MLTTDQIRTIEEARYPLMKDIIDLMIEHDKTSFELDHTDGLTEEDEREAEARLENILACITPHEARLEGMDDVCRAIGHDRKIHFLGQMKTLKEGSTFTASSYDICASIAKVATMDSDSQLPSDETFTIASKLFEDYKAAIEDMIASIDKEQ